MWINGQPGENIAATDRGLLYGDGLFETLLVQNGRVILLEQHLQRLKQGCAVLGLAYPLALHAELDRFLESSATPNAVLKIILTRGSGGRGYKPPTAAEPVRVLQLHPVPADIALKSRVGIIAMMCRHPISSNSRLAGLKHLNRLDQVLGSMELPDNVEEGLMSDDTGAVIEGTRSNLFLVRAGQLHTPDLSQAGVRGILRSWLIDRFATQHIDVQIDRISCEELENASEMFICNSVLGVWPITQLILPYKVMKLPCGPFTRQAQQFLSEIYHHE
jgi:4-amino-4-deoxychorismate lyase